nr:hypothetical protein [Haladaptatus sp. W1]
MPDQPVRLRDEVLFHVGRALADAHDSESVFPPAFADLDEHLARLAHPAALRDVLVALLDHQQERLLQLLLLGEQVARRLADERVGLVLVQIPRHVDDDGDVLFERQRRDLLGVFRADLDVTLLVGADVEEFVLLFQAVVLAVRVDDSHRITRVQQLLDDDGRRVRLPAPRLSGDEPASCQDFDDRNRHFGVVGDEMTDRQLLFVVHSLTSRFDRDSFNFCIRGILRRCGSKHRRMVVSGRGFRYKRSDGSNFEYRRLDCTVSHSCTIVR